VVTGGAGENGGAANAETLKEGMVGEGVVTIGVTIDGGAEEKVRLPSDFILRRNDLCWKYGLVHGRHLVRVRVLEADKGLEVRTRDYIVYDLN
jgi:hypothetical protein